MPPPAVLTPIDAEAVAAVQRDAPPEDVLARVAETFAALADPTRVRILYALIRRPLCVRDLAIIVGITESGVSHQLRFLRDRRIVASRRLGNVIEYAVDDAHVAALFREAECQANHVRQEIPDHPYPTSLQGKHRERANRPSVTEAVIKCKVVRTRSRAY